MEFVTLDPVPPSDAVDDGLSRRYLALIAEVAGRLLAAEEPDGLVDTLFAMIRTELRLDAFSSHSYVEGRLVLETHGGLTDSQVESAAELALGQAVSGIVARDRTARHVTDIQGSDDPVLAPARAAGLDTCVCVPLLHGAELIGTLGFGRRWASRFGEEELHFLTIVCNYVALAKHRLRSEERLREHVATQERLLGELNHRVRNALQLAISITVTEARTAESDAARAALSLAADRLQVLAAAHRPLYATAQADAVDLQTLLQGVIEQAIGAPMLIEADGAYAAPIERAVALALLVHEIAIGQDRDAPPRVRLVAGETIGGNQSLRIEFIGSMDHPPSSGLTSGRIVRALSSQLRASIEPVGPDGLVLVLPQQP